MIAYCGTQFLLFALTTLEKNLLLEDWEINMLQKFAMKMHSYFEA